MSDQEQRQQQEYEFVMEGITTRMQIAMEKLSESNKVSRTMVKYVCIMSIVIILAVMCGLIAINQLWFQHCNDIRNSYLSSGVVESADAEISEFRSSAADR